MSARNAVPATVFYLSHVIAFPLLAVAYVFLVLGLIVYSRLTGASTTVLASFGPRWMMHLLHTRRDDACARLMRCLPEGIQLGYRLMFTPTMYVHRVTGYLPKIFQYPYPGEASMGDQPAARTTFYDMALLRHFGHINQLVILGAGLDTRCYRLPVVASVRCFEVDTPKTQRSKRALLERARVDTTRVTFVAADFEHEDWYEKLVSAGFDPRTPTFFLWESVCMYLDQIAVERTLRTVAGTAPGSVLAFDYVSSQLVHDQSPWMRYVRIVLNAVGEPWDFGIDSTPPVRPRVEAFLKTCGLILEGQRNFGQETETQYALAGFAVARVG